MNFEQLDKQMRAFERTMDQVVMPGVWMVARIDGRNFTRLTKEICQYEAPFDIRFRDAMVTAVKRLMDCGFQVIYGFTQSDEISLLFALQENSFARKTRKYNSILAGEASAAFSLATGHAAAFDCRMIPLPNKKTVQDYFSWRQEDACRNALNGWCYWTLRKENMDAVQATSLLAGESIAWKNEFLYQRGMNFNDIPLWQKRGIGLYKKETLRNGVNPVTGQSVQTVRNKLYVDLELSTRDAYRDFIGAMLKEK